MNEFKVGDVVRCVEHIVEGSLLPDNGEEWVVASVEDISGRLYFKGDPSACSWYSPCFTLVRRAEDPKSTSPTINIGDVILTRNGVLFEVKELHCNGEIIIPTVGLGNIDIQHVKNVYRKVWEKKSIEDMTRSELIERIKQLEGE